MDYSLKGAVPDPFQFLQSIHATSGVLPTHLGKALLIGIFLIFFILYLIVSIVLFYHWQTYGMRNTMIIGAELLFSVVSICLFTSAFLLI
jgi:hypothetical protein